MSDVDDVIAEGMRRQLDRFRAAVSAGAPRIGWKIGASDRAAQERMGVPRPLLGWLDGRRLIPPGRPDEPPSGSRPLLEAEVAVSLGSDVQADASLADAARAIVDVCPAFEFVDATKPTAPLEELLATNVLHEAVMFGAGVAPNLAMGFAAAGFPSVTVNADLRATGAPGRVPDDLAETVAFAARSLAQHGERLLAGDRIICGTYIDPFPLAAGDEIEADFGPLGRLTVLVKG